MPTLFDIWLCVASGYQSKMNRSETSVKPCSLATDCVLLYTTAFHLHHCWPVFSVVHVY